MKAASPPPRPPGFHWSLVLILGLVTLGLFGCVWAIVQAVWARKVDVESKAVRLYVIALALYAAGAILEAVNASIPVQAAVQVAAALIATFGAFSVKNTLARYIARVEGGPAYLERVDDGHPGRGLSAVPHEPRAVFRRRHRRQPVLAGAQ